MVNQIKLSEIPEQLLPMLNNKGTNRERLYLRLRDNSDVEITGIYFFRDQYRVNTLKGEFRVDDATIWIY